MGSACGREHGSVGQPEEKDERQTAGSASKDEELRPEDRRATASSEGSGGGGRRQVHTNRSVFITHAEGRIEDLYEMGNKKGEGTQGVVFIATRKSDGALRAVKRVPKSSMKGADMQAFMKEVKIMRSMDHPNIIKLYDTYEDRKNTYLVMELCTGGELLDKIIAQGTLSEAQTAVVVQQVLRSVLYMHEQDIAHRDLKPENFLLAHDGPIDCDNLVKLIDFGIACECKDGQILTELRGTPFYAAPQVVTKRYDKKCDVWSVGVIMYTLLTGSVPFNGEDDKAILDKVRAGVAKYHEKDWREISPEAKDLVKKMLTRNPAQRIQTMDALHHAWIVQVAPESKACLPRNFVRKLNSFRQKCVVKKAALQIVAGEMDDASIRKIRKVFQSFDQNGDGLLTIAEISEGVKQAGLEVPDNFSEILRGVDADGSGIVDYTEFLAALLDKRTHLSEQACRQAFDKFDKDGDGKIKAAEIMHALAGGAKGAHKYAKEAETAIRKYDTDGDGGMGFPEFMRMMNSGLINGASTSSVATGQDEHQDSDDCDDSDSDSDSAADCTCVG